MEAGWLVGELLQYWSGDVTKGFSLLALDKKGRIRWEIWHQITQSLHASTLSVAAENKG